MKALRNFEALFVAIVGLACIANAAFDRLPPAPQPAAQQVSAAVPVVVVSAKRLSAAEKQASLAEERKAAPASKI